MIVYDDGAVCGGVHNTESEGFKGTVKLQGDSTAVEGFQGTVKLQGDSTAVAVSFVDSDYGMQLDGKYFWGPFKQRAIPAAG